MEKYPTVSQQDQQHQNNSSFELIEDNYSTVIPAEALLGISPTSNETAGRFLRHKRGYWVEYNGLS